MQRQGDGGGKQIAEKDCHNNEASAKPQDERSSLEADTSTTAVNLTVFTGSHGADESNTELSMHAMLSLLMTTEPRVPRSVFARESNASNPLSITGA